MDRHRKETQTQSDTGIADTRRGLDIHTDSHPHTPTHIYLPKLRSHTRGCTPTQRGTRADRYQTCRGRGVYKTEAQTENTHKRKIHRQAHRGKRHTQKPKMHGDADRRIRKQRYSSRSTRRGRSKTPTPRAHTEGLRRKDTPRDPVTQRAASRTETHKQKASETQAHAQEDTPSFRHAHPEGHTPTLHGCVCGVAGGRGKCSWSSLAEPPRTEHLAARPSQHLPGKTLPAYL